MTAGDSKAALTITPKPALAPSPQPRPAPTARALPPGLVAQVGQNWTPIVGQNWMPIDTRLAGVKECLCECDRLRLDSERIWVDDAARQVQRVEILRFASSRVTSTGISSSQFVKFQLRTLELLGDTMNVTAPASLRSPPARVT